MTADEIRTLRDLNYLARKKLALSQFDIDRLYAMNQEVMNSRPSDPDVGYLLGLMAATDDGKYWRGLIDRYALSIGATVKSVNIGPIGTAPAPAPTPAPTPAPSPSPSPGGAGADGVTWIPAPFGGGAAIYFESDTNFTGGQRPAGTRFRQVFGFSESGDGGGGLHMNVVYPENGERAYIPDPTRWASSYRLDRQGMMSINLQRAGAEFAPGKYAVTAAHRGQLAVLIPDENGDFTIRLPQGGRLFVEKGNGNNDRVNGNRETVSRQEVLLGPDVGSPAVGGLPGGGGT